MAITQQGGNDGVAATTPKGIVNNLFKQADPAKYTSLDEFIDEVNAPDIRASLIKTYGDQGITGFLKLTGAVNAAGTADEITYWEEARLHQSQSISIGDDAIAAGKTQTVTAGSADAAFDYDNAQTLILRKGDVVLMPAGERAVVTSVTNGDGAFTVANLADANLTELAASTDYSLPIIGNMYGQGTAQPTEFLQSNVVKRTNTYNILKETYEVTGSQATNIGYIDIGGGDYRWYLKSEQDTRQRFLDKREMMMLLGEKVANTTNIADATYGGGSEGYFAAIENRGIVNDGLIDGLDDVDALVKMMDKNGCPPEYAVYTNTAQMLKFHDTLAGVNSGGGLANSYGAFNNSKDMAVNLGFQSFARGGYTYHLHNWKLLNDPTLLAQGSLADNVVQGCMIPLTTVADPQSGNRAPALEMNYKSTNGYSREMEHWVTGGSVLGFNNRQDGKDVATFNYRSETCLVTRAANQHVLLKN